MGVRLIVEVLDHWQDVGLTAGERGDLLVLAENANDKSRETWGAVHAPHILKRAAKTPASWRIAINRLMKKKALEFARRDGKEVRGYTGQHAVYRLVELCPEPPHSGYKGLCTKPEKEGHPAGDPAQGEGYPSANPVGDDQGEGYLTANPEGYLTANAVEGLGYLTATERVSGQLTPTPLVSSFDLSSKDSPSSSVAEDVPEASADAPDGGGGGGGGDSSSEDQDQNDTRAAALVAKLDYRGKAPDKRQQRQLCSLVAAALTAGWSERGLTRYLDISDDPKVRTPAGLYLHRLNPDRLPDSGQAEAVAAGLPPIGPDCYHDPGAATDASLRTAPLGGPCPNCHPDAMKGSKPGLPPVCDSCVRANPAARTNIRFRTDPMSFTNEPCPHCHPDKVGPDRPGADGGMWDRAMARAEQRMETGDWKGAGPDERIAGWAAVGRKFSTPQPQIARNGHQNYQLPADHSVYDNGFGGGYQPYRDPENQSVYDKDL